MNMKPLAILKGMRTPFCKAHGEMADVHAVDLGTAAVAAVLEQASVAAEDVDEVVMGNVSGPPDAANVARVVALKAGIPQDRIAHTVNRNCASGMESILTAWQILREGRAKTIVAGGTESMSNIPLLLQSEAARLLMELGRAKSLRGRLMAVAKFRPSHFKPVPGVLLGLTDPFCGLNMGQTAEVLAQEFGISREDQDRFALDSHLKAAAARERCFLSGEIAPFRADDRTDNAAEGQIEKDNGPRANQSLRALQKLRPIFAADGSVTPGNSCPLTDGAAAVVLANANEVDLKSEKPMGYVTSYAIAGCDPSRMGLGPVYATAKLLQQTGLQLHNFDLLEINEAFAVQVLACLAAFESDAFAMKELGLPKALGSFPVDRLNVHGGAIALGHPVGTTGTRMVITLLRSLREKGLHRGLVTLCVGGGQGVAMVLETEI
ncbi:MAG: acetyl-CoA C-acyltransferase [Fuerstiella sp.]|nr:acetyl-CoA C-acyltransferase [Fuerstiella sp.]